MSKHTSEIKIQVGLDENKIPEKTSYSIEIIKSPENEYDSYGENLLNSIDALFTFTEQNSTNSTFKQDFESFVQNEVVSVNPTNIQFNTDIDISIFNPK